MYAVSIFLIFWGIIWVITNIKYKQSNKKIQRTENAKKIDETKSFFDSCSNQEYSVVIFLLRNGNKRPYIEYEYHQVKTILDDDRYFNKTPYTGKSNRKYKTADGKITEITVSGGYQYLLTPDTYDYLEYILDKTGSISHFSRQEIDLEQE